ncbi:MAG: FtsX-like permease family protein [Ilumatobacteraceae bacterium]
MSNGTSPRAFATATGVTIKSEWPTLLAGLLLVVVVVGGVVAGQRAVVQAEQESLDRSLQAAAPEESRLRVTIVDEFDANLDPDPLAAARAALDVATEELDPVAVGVFGAPRLVADSPRFTVEQVDRVAPGSPTTAVFRFHDDLDDHATLVARLPAGEADEVIDGRPVIEVEVARETLEVMGWELGSELLVDADTTDTMFLQFSGVPDPFWIRVAGVLELDPVDDPYWFDDRRLHRPVVLDTGLGAEFTAYVSLRPGQAFELVDTLGGTSALRAELRRELVPSAIDRSNVDDVQRAVTGVSASTSATSSAGEPAVRIGLGPLLREEANRRAVATAAVAIASIGVLAVAVAATIQLARVANDRRRPWWRLARTRGASTTTLVLSSVLTTAGIVAVGCVVGTALGTALQDAPSGALTDARAMVATFGLAVIIAAAADQVVEVRERLDGSRSPGAARARRATGAVVVIVAIAGAVTVRRRGVALDADSVDVALLLPIVFVPLAVLVVAGGLIPALVGGRSIGSLRLGVGRVVGVRRGLTTGGPGAAAVLALAASVIVVGVGVATSVSTGIEAASWRDVGAENRVDTTSAAAADTIAATSGTTVARHGGSAVLLERDGEPTSVELMNLDVDAHRRLTAGTPVAIDLPNELTIRSDDGSVPVVATERVAGIVVRTGDRLEGVGILRGTDFVVVGVEDELFGARSDTILAERTLLAESTGRVVSFERLWFDGPAPEGLTETVVVRADVEEDRRSAPLTELARRSFAAATLGAGLVAIGALVAGLVVTMRSRRRDVGLLAALGADGREFRRAVRAEMLPSALLGLVLGASAGALTLWLLDGRLDLAPLTGDSGTPITVDPLATVAAVSALAVAVVATVWVASRWAGRARVRAVDILRAEGAV